MTFPAQCGETRYRFYTPLQGVHSDKLPWLQGFVFAPAVQIQDLQNRDQQTDRRAQRYKCTDKGPHEQEAMCFCGVCNKGNGEHTD
jgi:hypothetical protein